MISRRIRVLGTLALVSILGWLVLLLWWLRFRQGRRAAAPPSQRPIRLPPVSEAGPRPTPDDLKRIEGIGPKIAAVLREAGIVTFAQLAASDAGRIRQVLRAGGVRIAFPETWPEQAGLAAAGEWEMLKALQAELKGGRRVTASRRAGGPS